MPSATTQNTGNKSTSSSTRTAGNASSSQANGDTAKTSRGQTDLQQGGRDSVQRDREQSVNVSQEGIRSSALSSYSPPTLISAYNTPFAFMRRFGEEMDRLFEDFGFAPLGLDPFEELSLGGGYETPSASGQRQLGRNAGRGTQVQGRGLPRQTGSSILSTSNWLPQVEVLRRDDSLVIRADLPGIKKDDVHVEIDDGRLTLSGSRHQESEDRDEGIYHSERSYGSFTRVIPLPKGIEADSCKAKFADGVLEVSIPLPKENAKSKRIEIR